MRARDSKLRHQILAVLADSTIAATIFYAIFVHLIRIPSGLASVVTILSAIAGILILIPLVLRGKFDPKGGTLVYASAPTVGFVSVLVGLFALYTLTSGPVLPAYLPMIATIFGGLLAISAAKVIPRS
jgi:hypothetical protein